MVVHGAVFEVAQIELRNALNYNSVRASEERLLRGDLGDPIDFGGGEEVVADGQIVRKRLF